MGQSIIHLVFVRRMLVTFSLSVSKIVSVNKFVSVFYAWKSVSESNLSASLGVNQQNKEQTY